MADITQRSFTGGEVSPAVGARVDLAKYQYGLSRCENFFVRAQGGVYNRSGLLYVGGVLDDTSNVRVIPFSFNTDQTYVLVFENLKLRIVQDAGFVLDSNSNILEIDTPYTSDQLFRLDYTQTDDVLTIVHPAHAPRDVSRLAADNFTLTIQDFTSNISAPTGLSSSDTRTGNDPVDDDGAGEFTKRYQYTVTAVGLSGEESVRSALTVLTTFSLSQTFGINLTWNSVPGVDYYRVYKDPSNNTGVYGWIGNSEFSRFTDFNIAPVTSDTPPLQRNPFDSEGNYPGAVTHYSQRRMYARTDNDRQTFFATQTGNLTSFRESIPSRSGDAITFRVFSNEANEIRYLVEAGSLVLFTAGAEFIIGDSETQPFTPETVSVRKQSNNGCAFIKPVVVNDVILYVQEKASRLRDFNYDFGSDRFRGDDLSVFAEHLFEGRSIIDMAYTDEPYSILWLVMDDGEMTALTYLREQDVLGWHRHTTKGEFLSVTSISEGNENVLYCAVRRTINGESKVYIERMESRGTTLENAFYVDSGLKYNGEPISTLTGLDHLEGEEVVALADGNVVKNLTVENGSVSLPRAASNIVVGLPYLSVIETLDIDSPDQSLKAINTNIAKVFINFEKSRGGWVGPKNEVRGRDPELREIKPRYESDGYGTIQLKSFGEEVFIESQWSTGGGFRMEQRDPLPMGILSVTPDVGAG